MAKAMWEGIVLAESDACELVEGNLYFPPDSVEFEHLRSSPTTTTCPRKGVAYYYNIEVHGKRNADAAWHYAEPKEAAKQIKGYVAFWKGVKVEE